MAKAELNCRGIRLVSHNCLLWGNPHTSGVRHVVGVGVQQKEKFDFFLTVYDPR